MTWVYVLLLPFQLNNTLDWVKIPASIVAAYIILGIALIGCEMKNPFGDDLNDLPLDDFCEQFHQNIDTIVTRPPPKTDDFVMHKDNMPLHPMSQQGFSRWNAKAVGEISIAPKDKNIVVIERPKRTEGNDLKRGHSRLGEDAC
jgi:ion channel-forming bestrophin family protein